MRRLRWLSTVRARVALTVAVAVLGSTVTATLVAYEVERHSMQTQFTATAIQDSGADVQEATTVAKTQSNDAAAAAAVQKFLAQNNVSADLDSYAVFTPSSMTATTCSFPPCTQRLPEPIRRSGGLDIHAYNWIDSGKQFYVANSIERESNQRLTLVEYYDYYSVQQQLNRLRNDLLRLDAIGVLAAALLGLAVSMSISRPVRRTAHAAQQLGAGDLDTRIPVRGSGELGDLAVNFNTMAQRLSDTLTDLRLSQSLQQRFVADVSHELRTPLAAMVAAGEGLDSADPALRTRASALVREQTRRMAKMVDDLLEMSRFDAGQTSVDLEPIDLAELARDVVRTVAPDADVRVTAFGDVTVDVDARRVHTILRNLIVNAVQHGEPVVDVVVDARADPVVVTVADDGPGVAAELVDTVFDRFVRADTARTSSDDADAVAGTSTGLGLAIAAENAHLHGATLEIARSGRSAFSLHLPRARVVDPQASDPAPVVGDHKRPRRVWARYPRRSPFRRG